MIEIEHEWDKENYVKTLDAAYEEYRKACYGDSVLPEQQVRETKQAFLSGVLWLSTRDGYCPDDLEKALRKIIGRHNPLLD